MLGYRKINEEGTMLGAFFFYPSFLRLFSTIYTFIYIRVKIHFLQEEFAF